MNKLAAVLLIGFVALMISSCRLPGYRRPADGWLATDESGGLQVSAKKLRSRKSGFEVYFDLRNVTDTGILLPLDRITAHWGSLRASVDLRDRRKLRKRFPIVSMRPESASEGLFADTHWVTPIDGEKAAVHGEALYLGPNKTVEKFRVLFSVVGPADGDIKVTFSDIHRGDARGCVHGGFATALVWTAEPDRSEAPN